MSMVEPGNCWDVVANGVPGDEEFENILSILDFPMETLEGDGFVEDWDISKSQYLGPIPSNVLMGPLTGPPTGPNRKINTGPVTPNPLKITGAPDQNHLPNHAEASSVFQTQSPVSVLESNGSCSGRKTLPVKSQPAVPARTRTKRVRPTGVNPWLLISPLFATSPKKRDKERRNSNNINNNKSSQLPVSFESSQKVETLPHHHRSAVVKKCTHCEVTKTPQWREGPLGPKTLCNACGVRYRSGRLFPEYRPAASPTFVPALHSNSHKKVIEMRNKTKDVPESKIEENPTSPQPEFVPMSSYLFDYIY